MKSTSPRTFGLPLALLGLALTACPAKDPARYVRLEGFQQGHGFAQTDTPLTYEVRFFDANGAPVEPGWFQWLGAANPLLPPDPSSVEVVRVEEPGVRRVTLTSRAQGRLSLEAIARPCPSCAEDHLGPLDFWVAAPAEKLVPMHPDPSTLVVGERRPFAAVAYNVLHTRGFPAATPMRTPDPVTVTSGDAAVATVDAQGVVTARGLGSTTLRFTAGHASASIRLQVGPGTVGKPPVGTTPILGVRSWTSSKTDHLLVVDEKEWPTFVMSPWLESELLLQPLLVASWTGSGFGAELLGRPLDSVGSASLSRDQRGRLYVTYTTSGPTPLGVPPGVVVAERPGEGGPGDWSTRELPRRPLLSSGQEIEPWYDIAGDRSSFGGLFALHPRQSQGLWAGYLVWGSNPFGTGELDGCVWTLRLAQITDDAITAEDVEVVKGTAEGCLGHGPTPEYHDLFLLPPKVDGGAPQVAVMRPPAIGEKYLQVDQLSREPVGGSWGPAVRVLPPADPQYDNLSVYGVKSVGLVQPVPLVGEAEWVKTGIYQGEVDDIFALRGFGSTWTGHRLLRPLSRLGPYGWLGPDDPAPYLAPSEIATQDTWLARWEVRGSAVSAHRLNFAVELTQGQFGFATVEPPRVALHTDSEAAGVRLTTAAVTPVAAAPVAVVGAGQARMVTLSNLDRPMWDSWEPPGGVPLSSTVLRSAAPGQPYLAVSAPDSASVSGAWFDLDGGVAGLGSASTGGLQVLRLGAAGNALELVSTTPAPGSPVAAQALGQAVFALVPPAAGTVRLLSSSDPLGGAPFRDLLAGVATAPQIDANPASLALLARPGTSEVYLLSHQANQLLGHLQLHVFGADGTLHGTNAALVPTVGGLQVTERIRTAGLASDGALYFFAIGSQGAVLLRSRDRLATIQVAAEFKEQWYPPTAIVELRDGRLVFAASRRVAPDIWKVGVWTSADGTTWTGPTLVRPDGGNGQRPAAISADPAGGALVLLHDNESMRAWGLTCGLNSTDGNQPGTGPSAMVVRVVQ